MAKILKKTPLESTSITGSHCNTIMLYHKYNISNIIEYVGDLLSYKLR